MGPLDELLRKEGEIAKLDSDRAIQVWAADRNRCVCKRPVEGPVHLNIKHCHICRLPMRNQRRQ